MSENKDKGIKQIMASIHAFQQWCPVIKKLVEGYGYTYADLEQLWTVIKPGLAEYKMTYSFYMDGKDIVLLLFHESGEYLESRMTIEAQGVKLSKMNDFQVIGSAITYFKRYMLIGILGIVTTDKDADAHLAGYTGKPLEPNPNVKSAYTGEPLTANELNGNEPIPEGN